MGVNASNSLADPIAPTYGTGALSIMSGVNTQQTGVNSTVGDFLNDNALPGGANGYTNNFTNYGTSSLSRAGGFNNGWTNGCLSKTTPPTYSSSLIRFGLEGRQS